MVFCYNRVAYRYLMKGRIIMNKFKKQIAIALAFCMLFSSFAVGTKASAHETDYNANQ